VASHRALSFRILRAFHISVCEGLIVYKWSANRDWGVTGFVTSIESQPTCLSGPVLASSNRFGIVDRVRRVMTLSTGEAEHDSIS